jgi:hypothetical protein
LLLNFELHLTNIFYILTILIIFCVFVYLMRMPKRKKQDTTISAPSRGRKCAAPHSMVDEQQSVADDTIAQHRPVHFQGPTSSPGDSGTSTTLSREEMISEVTQAVVAVLSQRKDFKEPQPLVHDEPVDREHAGTDIPPNICTNDKSHLSEVQSYDNELGHNVSNSLKLKIVNGEYVNFGLFVDRHSDHDPNDDTRYFSMQGGNIMLSSKHKPKIIADIQTWTDAFSVYASIYSLAHPECCAALFKYQHTIRLGAGRSKSLGWRDYDIQFRLKKERNPRLSFAIVLYMHGLPTQGSGSQATPNKCYEFNYKGQCSRYSCQF